MLHIIESVSNTVTRRINFPRALTTRTTRGESLRAKMRPLLSEHDKDDVRQTCALVFVRLGLPDETRKAVANTVRVASLCPLFAGSKSERASYAGASRTLGLARWKACFRAVRGALRIDRTVREDATDFASDTAPDVASTAGIWAKHPEVSAERRTMLARKVRYAHAQLCAAFSSDQSRKRKSVFRDHVSTLLNFSRIWGGRFARKPLCLGESEAAIRVALHRFREYLDKGEAELQRAALEGIQAGGTLRTLGAFSQIAENFASEPHFANRKDRIAHLSQKVERLALALQA